MKLPKNFHLDCIGSSLILNFFQNAYVRNISLFSLGAYVTKTYILFFTDRLGMSNKQIAT